MCFYAFTSQFSFHTPVSHSEMENLPPLQSQSIPLTLYGKNVITNCHYAAPQFFLTLSIPFRIELLDKFVHVTR